MNDRTYVMEIEHRLRERAYRRALGDPERAWLATERRRGPAIELAGVGHALRAGGLTMARLARVGHALAAAIVGPVDPAPRHQHLHGPRGAAR